VDFNQFAQPPLCAPSRSQVLPDGRTGRVAFNSMGDRINAEYKVVNMHSDRRSSFAKGVEVGTYRYSKVRQGLNTCARVCVHAARVHAHVVHDGPGVARPPLRQWMRRNAALARAIIDIAGEMPAAASAGARTPPSFAFGVARGW